MSLQKQEGFSTLFSAAVLRTIVSTEIYDCPANTWLLKDCINIQAFRLCITLDEGIDIYRATHSVEGELHIYARWSELQIKLTPILEDMSRLHLDE